MPFLPAGIAKSSRVAFLCLFAAVFPGSAEVQDLFDPFTGYRMAHYRSPAPTPPEGIRSLAVPEVIALRKRGAVLLDVHPLRFVEFDEEGEWITPAEHMSLPDAIWLPVVGWGNIEAWAEEYLAETLQEVASSGAPVIVFCQRDCWLSWNAVQRVRDLGYAAMWFPGGVDEWVEAGKNLSPVRPWPR